MLDLRKIVQSYDDETVLLVTDFNIHIVAEEILKTISLFKRYDDEDDKHKIHDKFITDIMETFSLDIENNHFHMILWENWINFMCDIDLLQVGTRWANATHKLDVTDSEIEYLEEIIREDK